ncbi:dihydrofolate reductase [bacterium]|nr:MAG: dihydrofolate reductase [bacterium]
MIVSLIAAHTPSLVIGKNGAMPWHYPEDLKHFKSTTLGFPILMGRKTFESIGSKPLPGRQNIILSNSIGQREDCIVINDPTHVFDLDLHSDKLFVVGGAVLYEYYLPFASELVITEIKNDVEGDTFFPEYRDKIGSKWIEASREIHDAFDFITYRSV